MASPRGKLTISYSLVSTGQYTKLEGHAVSTKGIGVADIPVRTAVDRTELVSWILSIIRRYPEYEVAVSIDSADPVPISVQTVDAIRDGVITSEDLLK